MSICQQILSTAQVELFDDEFWGAYISTCLANSPPSVSAHLAIFVDPFLQYVLDGKKTIESRFSIRQAAPYGIVKEGDIVFIKRAGGPVVGICLVTHAWSYDLDPESLLELRSTFSKALCAEDPEFWAVRADAAYATLMKIENVRKLSDINVNKTDRRGWVVLRKRTKQLSLWED